MAQITSAVRESSQPKRRLLANAIRFLSLDAVQQANSGHPGMPMGMADIAEVLWNDFLSHNPGNPRWANRDRFVVSNGHGSMLLYSLLHLTGYPLPLQELRNFRQLGAKTAGHPEYDPAIGIETTTGPLGQGLANAVGMALAERVLAASFNRPGHEIVDHHTYVFLGDGCLMEGISHEACSLAGTLRLGRLICLYDDNGISIDGEVDGWFTDDTPARFEAYGWQVVREVDGHDPEAVRTALTAAKADDTRPTLICCRTVIGFGAPNKQGTEATHGAPLGTEEIAATRAALDWPHAPFVVPEECYAGWDARSRGAAREAAWQQRYDAYAAAHPELAAELTRRMCGELPADWRDLSGGALAEADRRAASVATRKASQQALDALAPALPELLGGSADLAGSNLTIHKGSRPVSGENFDGNYVYFGVREFGMAAVCNGLALHGGLIPYSATFLIFSDYARNALRMAALMRIRHIMVFTHDSIGLGEDGPTHQPIEHLASLRLIPNLTVWRPCDAVESMASWIDALERTDGPTALVFTRQGVPHQPRTAEQLALIRRGGYVLSDSGSAPQLVLMATGSEVGLAVAAARELAADGVAVRVVSMPCNQLFDRCDAGYRAAVLPAGVPRLALEAGVSEYWRRYVGDAGDVIGIDRYGESAPAEALFEHFGLTVVNVIARAHTLLNVRGDH
jgi:transketolase